MGAATRNLRTDKNCHTASVSLLRPRHDILDICFCLLSRVLQVTLANWQGFGFEFHLRLSPPEFKGVWMISRSADYYITCYTVLTRSNKVETADHGRNSWLSVWTALSCLPFGISTRYESAPVNRERLQDSGESFDSTLHTGYKIK